MITLTIETYLPGEANDVRLSGLTLLTKQRMLEIVHWNPLLENCVVTVETIDTERNRIMVTPGCASQHMTV